MLTGKWFCASHHQVGGKGASITSISSMQIIPLSEGAFTIDQTKLFIPFKMDEDVLQERARGSLLVEVQPFIVVTSKDILLMDTGLGFEVNGQLQIHENCRRNGIDPLKVTKVLLSHLHKDHAGGATREDRLSSRIELSFPNANYYVQARELAYAFEKGLPSYIPHELELLNESSRVILLQDDKGTIDDYITYEVTGAHCPFHQVFWVREEAEIIFFGADDAPQLQQMKHRFVAKYDFDGRKAADLRSEWKTQGEKEGWKFLYYHETQ